MKIISVNVNGIRSAAKKGFFTWLKEQNADVVCLQELKAQAAELQDPIFHPAGYEAHFHFAEKKGYSGVGIYTRKKSFNVVSGLGFHIADTEGRYVEVDFGNLIVASVYLPSGSSGDERQAVKFEFLAQYAQHLQQIKQQQKDFIICGDWNIAHKEIDLKNWRGNRKNSGFLPEERAWMDQLFGEFGFIDAFRAVNQEPDQYTWWSNRGRAWEKNVGWRIDYQVVTSSLAGKIKNASIYKEQRFSDHAPLIMEYELPLS